MEIIRKFGIRDDKMKSPLIVAVIILFGVVTGLLTALDIRASIIPLAILLCVPLVLNSTFRFLYIVMGSLFILGSVEFTTNKLAFFVGIIILVMSTFRKIDNYLIEISHFKPIIITSLLFASYVLISMIIAIVMRQATIIFALRDATPYFLFSLSPIIALDVANGVKQKKFNLIFLITLIIGTLFFSIGWISRRGISSMEYGSLGLVSFLIPLAFFANCASKSIRGDKHIILWTIISGLVLASMFATGTRTSIVALVAPIVIAFIGRTKKLLRMITFLIGIVIFGIMALFTIINLTGSDIDAISGRLGKLSVLSSRQSMESDLSYLDRNAQTQIAIFEFKKSPIIGMGVGVGFSEWGKGLNIDSPIAFLAKFGLLGVIMLLSTIATLIRFLWVLFKCNIRTVPVYSMIGFISISATLMILASPFEDKGFSIAYLLLLASVIKEIRKVNSGGGKAN
jgi:hypothetical protein